MSTYIHLLPSGRAVRLLSDDAYISAGIEAAGRLDHDWGTLDLIDPWLRSLPRPLEVVDIGAYIGDHTEYYRHIADHVIAIEPDAEAFSCLAHNMGYDLAVLCLRMGLGAESGRGTPTRRGELNPGNTGLDLSGTEVPVMCLDDMTIPGERGSLFLKIDAEGMESLILQGASRTIAKRRPLMLIEVNGDELPRYGSSPQALIAQIEGMGYTVQNLAGTDPGVLWDALCIPLAR